MNERKFKPWHVRITERFDELMERLAIPNDIAEEFKAFLFEIAKEQYKRGNSSGIAWFAKQNGIKRQTA